MLLRRYHEEPVEEVKAAEETPTDEAEEVKAAEEAKPRKKRKS